MKSPEKRIDTLFSKQWFVLLNMLSFSIVVVVVVVVVVVGINVIVLLVM